MVFAIHVYSRFTVVTIFIHRVTYYLYSHCIKRCRHMKLLI